LLSSVKWVVFAHGGRESAVAFTGKTDRSVRVVRLFVVGKLCYPQLMQTDHAKTGPHRIELNIREMVQLFNTMDPSPFKEKDLDRDAEEFIVSWAREFPMAAPIELVVHLRERPTDRDPQLIIQQAVHHYFEERARINRLELRRLFKEGQQSLLIGLLFLTVCLTVSNLIAGRTSGTLSGIAQESLTIAGWVAMWRPMQIYLYD
jgi:hypothetical protein